MIIDISDVTFKRIMNDKKLSLPIRWDGADFSKTLSDLFKYYKDKLNMQTHDPYGRCYVDTELVNKICKKIITAVNSYLNGSPSNAYRHFNDSMKLLMNSPLNIYSKQPEMILYDKEPHLYRAVGVDDNKPYGRTRVFHTPFNLRSKVSTSRYSIAGYPSLYLGTSLELCCEEIHRNPYQNLTLASEFKFNRYHTYIEVIELGIKPQDFIEAEGERNNKRRIHSNLLNDIEIKRKYLLWYPLIAACSFIRTYRNDPFAPEYIIPQLLMQWVRSKLYNEIGREKIIGIRYFSCSSVRASDMGFNYVFPTSGKCLENSPYCSVLSTSFKLTKPVYIHEYADISKCEDSLKTSNFNILI